MTEEMIKEARFFDVFLSYRHHDADKIKDLKEKIKFHGFESFQDLDFPSLRDPTNVTPEKVDNLRRKLSQSTCLIFAYSRPPAEAIAKQTLALADQGAGSESPAGEATAKQDSALGVWMPWELGFFDGSIMSYRIGVYLLDYPNGEPDDFKPQEYFKGCEYLQLYTRLTDLNLKEFLNRTAVRERRIDNVGSAFVWFDHLREECWANPTNVALGVAEWCVDHAARYWQERSVQSWADACRLLKATLDDYRVTGVRWLRSPLVDALFDAMHAQQQTAEAMIAEVARVATGAKEVETQPLRKEDRPAGSANKPLAPLPMINPWFLFEPLFAALAAPTPLASGVARSTTAL